MGKMQVAGKLAGFWTEKYLIEYISCGGSKIKFVTGRPGSGKSYFLREFGNTAQELDFITVRFSAKKIWLHDFKDVYLEILGQCDLEKIIKGCARHLIEEMGYDPEDIPNGQKFIDYLSDRQEGGPLNRRAMREALGKMFQGNPLLDYNFAYACSLLTGGELGYPALEDGNRELLLGWLHGDKSIKLAQLRALDMSPSKITKQNARHMLRSLAEVTRLGGSCGILVLIDDLDILQSKSGVDEIHYTKLRREDTYESIRQLIDDIDTMHHIMFVYGMDRLMLDNERAGLKSYQALWMRIQNEIVSGRFNCFTDIADLDRLADQELAVGDVVRLSEEMAEECQAAGEHAQVLTREQAEVVREKARLGGLGLPEMVRRATLGQDTEREVGADEWV